MFYPEYILFILIIVSFILHLLVVDLYSFFLYNTSPVVFGLLSLYSIYDITNERTIENILYYIMYDMSGMSIFVELFLLIFILCVTLMCYNFFIIYQEYKVMHLKK
jgi:hypothetical protein